MLVSTLRKCDLIWDFALVHLFKHLSHALRINGSIAILLNLLQISLVNMSWFGEPRGLLRLIDSIQEVTNIPAWGKGLLSALALKHHIYVFVFDIDQVL